MANNPPGCAAAFAALDVLVNENLTERANRLGEILIKQLQSYNLPHVVEFTGAGMFWAIVIEPKPPKVTGRRIVALLAQRGVLASATVAGTRVRICPPLTIGEEDLLKGAEIVARAFEEVEDMDFIPGEAISSP